MDCIVHGVIANVRAMTAFLNPQESSYACLGNHKAPRYISWSAENRSQLVRIPAAVGEYRRAELRSPDPAANPYLAFTLMIRAGLEGIMRRLPLGAPSDLNLYTAPPEVLAAFEQLPGSRREACAAAAASDFIRACIPSDILAIYCGR